MIVRQMPETPLFDISNTGAVPSLRRPLVISRIFKICVSADNVSVVVCQGGRDSVSLAVKVYPHHGNSVRIQIIHELIICFKINALALRQRDDSVPVDIIVFDIVGLVQGDLYQAIRRAAEKTNAENDICLGGVRQDIVVNSNAGGAGRVVDPVFR